jgi:nitrate/TMAO reductase-like tetraheme cytochrome c subunit
MRSLAAIGAISLLAGCNDPASPKDVHELMTTKVQVSAQVYWDAVQYVSDERGVREILPTTDAEWERTRKAAADLQDYGKVLQTDAYSEGRNPDWKEFSQGLIQAAEQAEQAAADRDKDSVFKVGATVYNVCLACHIAYPPAESEEVPKG